MVFLISVSAISIFSFKISYTGKKYNKIRPEITQYFGIESNITAEKGGQVKIF